MLTDMIVNDWNTQCQFDMILEKKKNIETQLQQMMFDYTSFEPIIPLQYVSQRVNSIHYVTTVWKKDHSSAVV